MNPGHKLSVAIAVALAAIGSSFGATFTVTDADDSGPGSLRQAILDANTTVNGSGPDVIVFAIPGAGPHTI